MPTYINNSNKTIYLQRDNIFIKPNEQKVTRCFYDDIPELELVSVEPYETPIIYSGIDTITANTKKEYYIFNARLVHILPLNDDAKIYLHVDTDNGNNVIYQLKGLTFQLSNTYKMINKIYIEPSSDTDLQVYILILNNDEIYF